MAKTFCEARVIVVGTRRVEVRVRSSRKVGLVVVEPVRDAGSSVASDYDPLPHGNGPSIRAAWLSQGYWLCPLDRLNALTVES